MCDVYKVGEGGVEGHERLRCSRPCQHSMGTRHGEAVEHDVFRNISEAAERRMCEFNAQELANTA